MPLTNLTFRFELFHNVVERLVTLKLIKNWAVLINTTNMLMLLLSFFTKYWQEK
jgi:hypothetical protein